MTYLTDAQKYTLEHALSVAAERFDADAATWLEYAKHDQSPVLADLKDNYRRIAEQFTKQAREARDLYAILTDAEQVRLTAPPPSEFEPRGDASFPCEFIHEKNAACPQCGQTAAPLNLVDQFGDAPISRAILDTDLFNAGTLRADADGTVYRALPARHASKQRWRRITNVGGTVLLAGAEKYARIVDTRRSAAERYFSTDDGGASE